MENFCVFVVILYSTLWEPLKKTCYGLQELSMNLMAAKYHKMQLFLPRVSLSYINCNPNRAMIFIQELNLGQMKLLSCSNHAMIFSTMFHDFSFTNAFMQCNARLSCRNTEIRRSGDTRNPCLWIYLGWLSESVTYLM